MSIDGAAETCLLGLERLLCFVDVRPNVGRSSGVNCISLAYDVPDLEAMLRIGVWCQLDSTNYGGQRRSDTLSPAINIRVVVHMLRSRLHS